MQPEDDDQSIQDPDQRRSVNIRISRDTLLLLGALAFLILAVGLTFLFPLAPGEGEATPTAIAEAATATVAAAGIIPSPPAGYPAPGEEPAGYPAPGAETPANGFASPEPTGAAATPGIATSPTAEASPAAVSPDAERSPDAYPAPEGTAPTQPTNGTPIPTFDPARPTATAPAATFPPPAATFPPPATAAPPTRDEAVGAQPTAAQPTSAPPPTAAPPAQSQPAPTQPQQPQPTTDGKAPGTAVPTSPLEPTIPPVDVLRGTVRWGIAESPIIVPRDLQLAPGAVLIIEPGVEVRLAPRASIFIDGAELLALGRPELPISFVGLTAERWSGLFARPGSRVQLDSTRIRGGGAAGTILVSERSDLIVRGSQFNDNGGSLLVQDSLLEMRDSEIAGNDMPFGAALDVGYTRGGFATLTGNRIGGNLLTEGAPAVRIQGQSTFDIVNLTIEGNLFRDGIDNLVLRTNNEFRGTIACNSLVGGNLGLNLRTQTEQVPPSQLQVFNNTIDFHTPPIIPIYLEFGIGRGAASEIELDMRNNWWGDATGPYEPTFNPLGRGDAVGVNILYEPWLTEPPACAPIP